MTLPIEDDAIPLDAPPPTATAEEFERVQKQAAEYKYRLAELDTSLRRLRDDADRQRKYAHESFARDLLAVVDNLERAVAAATQAGESGPLIQGVTATASQLVETLKRYAVTKMPVAPGTPFDPNRHQAVAQVPSAEFKPNQVVQVYQSGFLLHDRVLRPAAVVVAAEAGG